MMANAAEYEMLTSDPGYWKERAYQAESLVHDNDSYWLRQYAGMAMQGLLTVLSKDNEELIAKHSVIIAIALLAEVKRKEKP